MRTIVELPEGDVAELDRVATEERCSRAALIRRAVSALLADRRSRLSDRPAFGIWRGRSEDGLAYERRAREEWES